MNPESHGAEFTTTHWSVVLEAGTGGGSPRAAQALERLCRIYWPPLYAYVRRQGHDVEEAKDLTQDFFARLLEKDYLSLADPVRGRFRTFLLTSLKNFLSNEWKRSRREKRGGGQVMLSWDDEAADGWYQRESAREASPDRVYEQRWALALLEQTFRRLDQEYASAGLEPLFGRLKDYVWGEKNTASYLEVASALGMSEGAVKVAVHRARRRFRDLLREEIANTVVTPEEVDEELRLLMEALRAGA